MLSIILTAGSLFGSAPPPADRTVRYSCDGDLEISVTFEKSGVARVFIAGGGYRLRKTGENQWSDGQGQSLVVDDSSAVWSSGVEGKRACSEKE
ncbi:MAG: hypothetical protein U1E28_11755 [Beijerinckiaceae bacterium]